MANKENKDSATLSEAEIDAAVSDYLTQIARVAPLTIEQEVDLAIRLEAGLFAGEILNTEVQVDRKREEELHWVVEDGKRAKNAFLEANILLRRCRGGHPW